MIFLTCYYRHYNIYIMNLNIYTSLLASIITQVITGILEFLAVFIKTPAHLLLLKQLLVLELKCRQYGIDFVPIDIQKDFKIVLHNYFIKRSKINR